VLFDLDGDQSASRGEAGVLEPLLGALEDELCELFAADRREYHEVKNAAAGAVFEPRQFRIVSRNNCFMVKVLLQHGLQAFEATEVNNPVTQVKLFSSEFETECQRVAVQKPAVGLSTPLAECYAEA
jgi:hypothetical protein